MRAFHLILFDGHSPVPRRVDFEAEGPDHAFQIARNETDGVEVELWEGATLLAHLTKAGESLWKLDRCRGGKAAVGDRGPVLTAEL